MHSKTHKLVGRFFLCSAFRNFWVMLVNYRIGSIRRRESIAKNRAKVQWKIEANKAPTCGTQNDKINYFLHTSPPIVCSGLEITSEKVPKGAFRKNEFLVLVPIQHCSIFVFCLKCCRWFARSFFFSVLTTQLARLPRKLLELWKLFQKLLPCTDLSFIMITVEPLVKLTDHSLVIKELKWRLVSQKHFFSPSSCFVAL